MALTLKDGSGTQVAAVDPAHLAPRVSLRPADVTNLGSYQKSLTSGTMAAALGGGSPVYAFRYGGANLALVRRVIVSLGDLVAFTAGFITLNLFAARAFSASDTGGNAGTLTGNNGKLKTAFATTGVSDIRIANTGALTPGTRTLDTDPLGTISISIAAATTDVAGTPIIPVPVDLFFKPPGMQPLVLATNEGFVIQATVPATGTWQLGVDTSWDEVSLTSGW